MFWIIIFYVFSVRATDNDSLNRTFDLDGMFESLAEDGFEEEPDVMVKKLSINLEQLNLMNITNKLISMRRSMNTTDVQELVLKDFESRRLAGHGSKYAREMARGKLVSTKIYDLMLQTIYMARHKIKQIETDPYYNSKDTSYRIGVLYRRLRRIWKRIHDILATMETHKHHFYWFHGKFTKVDTYLTLHFKAAKLHIDFLYPWWVLIKLHETFHYRQKAPNTYPPKSRYKF